MITKQESINPDVPAIVLEAGSFLTLLLGGKENQSGYAYAELLKLLAERHLVRLIVPDVTLMEIFGTQAPVYQADLVGEPPQVSEKNVQYGYGHAAERVSFFRDLVKKGACEIVQTACGDEYVQRLHDLAPCNGMNMPTLEETRRALLQPKHPYFKIVKNNTLVNSQGELTVSGKKDRGELAVADAIKQIHDTQGWDARVFALFEGSDVRGRILQRIASEVGTPEYHQYSGSVKAEFNPNSKQCELQSGHVGAINFLSTKGFLAGMMMAAKIVKPSNLRGGDWYIVSPNESQSKEALHKAYAGIITNVNKQGLPRVYDKYRDAAVGDFKHEREHEFFFADGEPHHAPWREYVSYMTKMPELRMVLSDSVHHYALYHQRALLDDAKAKLQEIQNNTLTMSPFTKATLRAELERMTKGLTPPDTQRGR